MTSRCKLIKLDQYLIHKKGLKCNKDIDLKSETIKLEEYIGKNLLDTGLDNDFLDLTPKTQATKTITTKNKLVELHQTKKLLCSKGNNQQSVKEIYRMGKNIFMPNI